MVRICPPWVGEIPAVAAAIREHYDSCRRRTSREQGWYSSWQTKDTILSFFSRLDSGSNLCTQMRRKVVVRILMLLVGTLPWMSWIDSLAEILTAWLMKIKQRLWTLSRLKVDKMIVLLQKISRKQSCMFKLCCGRYAEAASALSWSKQERRLQTVRRIPLSCL